MCWGQYWFPFLFVKNQDQKGKTEFERMPDIPVIAGDGITYGVACLQFLDSSLEVGHFVKESFTGYPFFWQCKVLLTFMFVFAV